MLKSRADFRRELSIWVRCLSAIAFAVACCIAVPPAGAETVSEFLQRCMDLAKNRRYGETIALLDSFIKNNKKEPIAYQTRSIALMRLGRAKEALEDLNRALALSPKNAAILMMRGELLLFMAQPRQALEDEDSVLQDPSFPLRARALFLKAHALHKLNRNDEALRCLNQSIKVRGGEDFHDHMLQSMILRRLNRAADALPASSQAISLSPKDPTGYLERASCYAMIKDEKIMFRDCQKAINADPSRVQSYITSAHLALALGRVEKQIQYLSRALQIVPNNIEAHRLLADAFVSQNKFDDAMLHAAKVVELDPENARAYYLRGFSRFQKQDFKGALKDANRVLSLEPDNTDGLYLAHISNFQVGNWDQALAQIDKRMKNNPSSRGDALIHKAIVYSAKEMYAKALEVLKNGEKEGCPRKDLCAQRMIAYDKLGRPDKARAEYRNAVRDAPNDVGLSLEYIAILWRLDRDNPEIVEECNRAIKLDPKAIFAYIIKATYLVHAKRPREALPTIEQALTLDRKNGPVYQIKGKAYKQLRRPRNETIAILNKARELGADYVDCSYHIADLLLSDNKADRALAELDAAIAKNPDVPGLHRLRRQCLSKLGKGQSVQISTLKIDKLESGLDPNHLVANHLRLTGSYQKAIRQFNVLIKTSPNDAQLLTDRGACFRLQKKSTEALLDLTQAVRLDPTLASAYFERACVYRDLFKNDRALIDALKTLALKPNEPAPRLFAAQLYFEKKQFTDVVEQLSVFLGTHPSNVDALLLRGKAYSQLNSSSPALEDYDRIVKIDPNNLGALRARLNEYLRLKQYTKVIEQSDILVRLDKTNYRVFEMRADAEKQLGQLKEAIDDYSKAIEITDHVGYLFQRRADLYDKLGRHDLAKRDRQRMYDMLGEFNGERK